MRNEAQLSAQLIPFYLGVQPDTRGRMIQEIWAWDCDRLEFTHDYIQWLFPLPDKSNFNLEAPILDPTTIEQFRTDSALQANLRQSLLVMLQFYGLQLTQADNGADQITPNPNTYRDRQRQWLSPRNHNYLRITRILKCLTILGLKPLAQAFYQGLTTLYSKEAPKIGETTWQFWTAAVQ